VISIVNCLSHPQLVTGSGHERGTRRHAALATPLHGSIERQYEEVGKPPSAIAFNGDGGAFDSLDQVGGQVIRRVVTAEE